MSESCVFCAIVAGTEPATFYARWDDAIAIAPLNPVVDRHVLVIPHEHVTDFTDGPDAAAAAMRRAGQLAWAAQLGDCNVITSRGPAATQTVGHLHLHVIPRTAGDGLALPWTTRPVEQPAEPVDPRPSPVAAYQVARAAVAERLGRRIEYDTAVTIAVNAAVYDTPLPEQPSREQLGDLFREGVALGDTGDAADGYAALWRAGCRARYSAACRPLDGAR